MMEQTIIHQIDGLHNNRMQSVGAKLRRRCETLCVVTIKTKILFFLFAGFVCTATAGTYVETQRISIAEIQSADKSSFFMVKTDEGPIWIIYRAPEVVDHLRSNPTPSADPNNLMRSERQDVFVVRPKCSCTGRTATYLEPGHLWLTGIMPAGFICEEDVSFYDMSGRVVSSTCEAKDFEVPRYKVIDGKYIEIDPTNT